MAMSAFSTRIDSRPPVWCSIVYWTSPWSVCISTSLAWWWTVTPSRSRLREQTREMSSSSKGRIRSALSIM